MIIPISQVWSEQTILVITTLHVVASTYKIENGAPAEVVVGIVCRAADLFDFPVPIYNWTAVAYTLYHARPRIVLVHSHKNLKFSLLNSLDYQHDSQACLLFTRY